VVASPGLKGPGLIILIPFVQQMVKVDLRSWCRTSAPGRGSRAQCHGQGQHAVLYLSAFVDSGASDNQGRGLYGRDQPAGANHAALRLGKHELDELLAERDRLNADIQGSLDQQTDAWGIKVTNGRESKHVDLNENMIRAIAKQAEAERLRRAKVINAIGEQQRREAPSRLADFWPVNHRRCSYAIVAASARHRERAVLNHCLPLPTICSLISSHDRTGEVTLIKATF